MFPTKCVPKIFLESDILKMFLNDSVRFQNSLQRLIGFKTLLTFCLVYSD